MKIAKSMNKLMDDITDNILIVGAGSVGALIGASLIETGYKVTFAGNPESNYTKQIKESGLELFYADGKRVQIRPSTRVRFVDTAADLNEKFDIIVVAVKSNKLIEIASYIKAHSTTDTILIHAQNGIPYWWFDSDRYLTSLDRDLYDKLISRRYLNAVDRNGVLQRNLGDRIIVGCVVKAPCQRSAAGQIKIRKPPRLILGLTKNSDRYRQHQTKLQNLCNLLSQSSLTATYTDKIRAAVCNKLAINVTTNVLSALTGRVIADLTANSRTNNLIQTIIAETNYIFSFYGIDYKDLPTERAVYSYIEAPGSQSHLPSLAQDLSQHKPGEINLITALVEMAQIANLNVPTLTSLSELLKLCQTYSIRSNNGKSHILTLDRPSDYCTLTLTNDVWQSNAVDKRQMSNLVDCLVQVNLVSALNGQLAAS